MSADLEVSLLDELDAVVHAPDPRPQGRPSLDRATLARLSEQPDGMSGSA